MSSPRRRSAIEEMDRLRFGGPTNDTERTVAIASQSQEIVSANPDRVLLMITNNGAETLYWSTRANPTASQGHMLGVNSTLILRVLDDGSLTGRRLYGGFPTAGTTITITEVERSHGE